MPTDVRIGLGSVNIGAGLLQGELSLSQTVEPYRVGNGIPFAVNEQLVRRQAAALSFATSDVTNTEGLTLVNGPQTPVAVGFTFGGSGPTYSAAISGVLTAAEYSFAERAIATCRLAYDAIGGGLAEGGGGSVGDASSVLLGLGSISWGGTGSQLRGSVTVSASAEFESQEIGAPLVLVSRDVRLAIVKMSATFAVFDSAPVGDAPANVSFVHHGGFTLTVQNAMLVRGETRFTERGLAVLHAEWEGTGLAVG
jgi:hypothetical protein